MSKNYRGRGSNWLGRGGNWKGGRYYTNGYVYVKAPPNHPYSNSEGYVFEHRLVMEKVLGRYLEPWEQVHHIDGVRDHNADDNLQLITPSQHSCDTKYCARCTLRNTVVEQDKRIRLLEWQVKQFNQAVYDKDEPNIRDILGRGL